MSIEPAKPKDWPGICWLLEYDDLPTQDLSEQSIEQFLVCKGEAGITGAVGVEFHEKVGLLRSLVVDEEYRGAGIGNQLVIAAESKARVVGISSLYLLTTTAQKYFQSRGYQAVERADAPEAIKRTSEFSGLCPQSSVLMVKHI